MSNISKLNGYYIKDATARSSITALSNSEQGHYAEVKGSLTSLSNTVSDNYDTLNSADSALSTRIDNIANLQEGSTTGDAELIDGRTIDDTTYTSIGSGLRTEFDFVNSELDDILYKTAEDTIPVLLDGYIKYTDYTIVDNSFSGAYKRTDYIKIPIGTTKILHNFRANGSAGYVFFKANKVAISGGNTANEISTVPSNAKYIMFTDYNLGADHTGRYYNMVSDYLSNYELNEKIEGFDGSIDYLKKGTIENVPTLQAGFVDTRNNTINNNGFDGFYVRTDYIEIPPQTDKIAHNFNCVNNCGYIFTTENKVVISGGNDLQSISTIPDNAKYIVISDYAGDKVHTGKYVNFLCVPSLKGLQEAMTELGGRSCNINNLVTYGDSHVERGLWQQSVLDYFNIENHTNLGVSSSTVAENEAGTVLPFVNSTRIQGIKNADPDTIIIIGGTNDVHLETPLGDRSQMNLPIGTKDKTTFYGAYSYLLETLLSWKPTLQIILCTTPQGYYDSVHPVSYEEISNVVRDIANYYSLPVADIFGKGGVNRKNLTTYSDDLIHYNTVGNKRVSKVIIDTINNSYIKYKDSDI